MAEKMLLEQSENGKGQIRCAADSLPISLCFETREEALTAAHELLFFIKSVVFDVLNDGDARSETWVNGSRHVFYLLSDLINLSTGKSDFPLAAESDHTAPKLGDVLRKGVVA